jgi:hypothetical protein
MELVGNQASLFEDFPPGCLFRGFTLLDMPAHAIQMSGPGASAFTNPQEQDVIVLDQEAERPRYDRIPAGLNVLPVKRHAENRNQV